MGQAAVGACKSKDVMYKSVKLHKTSPSLQIENKQDPSGKNVENSPNNFFELDIRNRVFHSWVCIHDLGRRLGREQLAELSIGQMSFGRWSWSSKVTWTSYRHLVTMVQWMQHIGKANGAPPTPGGSTCPGRSQIVLSILMFFPKTKAAYFTPGLYCLLELMEPHKPH